MPASSQKQPFLILLFFAVQHMAQHTMVYYFFNLRLDPVDDYLMLKTISVSLILRLLVPCPSLILSCLQSHPL